MDAGIAGNRHIHQSVTKAEPLPFLERHDVDAIHDDIFVNGARLDLELDLWNALSRVWLLWQILADLSLKRARMDSAPGRWHPVERLEDGALWFRYPVGLGQLLERTFDQLEQVRGGTVAPRTAAQRIFKMLRRAPSLETPVPLRVSASAPTVMPPWICSAAPLATEVPPAIVPSAVSFWMLSTPADTVVAPV